MSNATNQVEKHFQMHNIYKRSKRYFDVEKMKEQEHLQEIYRRKPNYSIETLDTRVDQSFFNSANAINKKLEHDISEFRKRYQDQMEAYTSADTINKYQLDQDEELFDPSLKTSRNKIKAPDLHKMQGRNSILESKSIYNNQNQFNNYFLASPRSRAQLNFSLNSPRSKSTLIQNPEQQPTKDSGYLVKVHEKNNFSSSVYKCLFEYSKVNKYANKSRKKKSQSKLKPIEKEKLQAAEKYVRVKRNPEISEFYFSIGNEVPMQMNFRCNKSNQFYFEGKRERNANEDYSARKRREDMAEKRLLEMRKRKEIVDCKEQLCDYKYFNRQFYRANK